jgi:hypothetical protein
MFSQEFRKLSFNDMRKRVDLITLRLRLVMVTAMLFDLAVTLFSQPQNWSLHPQTAFESNILFHYFLVQGLVAYVFLFLIYILTAFLLVSLLPRFFALGVLFSFLFCHYFRAACWLDYHGGPGMNIVIGYACILGYMIMSAGFSGPDESMLLAVRKLRWLMLAVLIFDSTCTLSGQPATYWQHPQTANEGFFIARFFIMKGVGIYLLYNMAIFSIYFFLVSRLSAPVAMVVCIAVTLSYFFGASTWINNGWHFSADGPIIFGAILAFIFARMAFPNNESRSFLPVTCRC